MSKIIAENSTKLLCTLFVKQFLKINTRYISISHCRKMRLVQYKQKLGGPQQLGAQLTIDGDIIDISAVDSTIPNSMVDFLTNGNSIYDKAKR